MLEARALTKTFQTRTGPVKAVDGIDLDVAPTEIVGFLGPNGAGKTTTQRMLTTLLSPSSGTASVAGHDLLHEPVEVRRRIGYVAQGGSTEPEALVREELVDQARLYGIGERDARARAHTVLGRLDLVGTSERQVKTLSGGQRRRLDIALGLIHSPSLLFLDEPTSGLDPQARANLWEHIERLREGGATIFLTTHYLEEADALCDRIMIIDSGRIVAEGSPETLKRTKSSDTVTLSLRHPEAASRAAQALAALPFASDVQSDGTVVALKLPNGGEALPAVFDALATAGVGLAGIEVHRPSLDDVFLSLTGRALRDEPAAAA
jgi:ABC-2 type transport system ATP-binding protein